MSKLIERLRLAAEDAAGGPPSAEQVDALIDLVDALEARLAALTTPQEAKSAAKVVPVSHEASASCSQGVCPSGCSHLMWECSACSCEGGWGASRERLEELAAQHVCVAVAPTPQERIDHAAKARYWLPQKGDGITPNHVAVAQVHATLALVEQQRIANLIAYSTISETNPIWENETVCNEIERLVKP